MKHNPPWADKILRAHWPQLQQEVPDQDWLPIATGKKFKEYGCGAYGCVYPTNDPNIVFKLTTDGTEANFINFMRLRGYDWPEGLVRYWAILPLDATYRKRKAWALWRTFAEQVGRPRQDALSKDLGFVRSMTRELRILDDFQYSADKARSSIKKSKHPQKLIADALSKNPKTVAGRNVAGQLRMATNDANTLMSGEHLYKVGEALITLLTEYNILLADVHEGNIGQVAGEWVITDPGHAVILE